MKKTFSSIDGSKFKENIKKFKMMSKGTDCLIRSGFCTSHNHKMIRKIVSKKMSSEDEYGVVTWTTRESTVLYCPSNISKQTSNEPEPMMSQLPNVGGTNQKRRKCSTGKDQSPLPRTGDQLTDQQEERTKLFKFTSVLIWL